MELTVYRDNARLEQDHWWFSARRQILRQVLRRHLEGRDDLDILEVGSGTGGNLNMLGGFGRVWALEPHAEARRLAEKKGAGAALLEGSVPDTDLGRRFDLICLFDVLEHIADDRAALEWADAHLQPGGLVLVTVPAFQFLWSGHDVAHHHFRRYRRDQVIAAGDFWRLRHATYFNCFLFLPIMAVRLTKRVFEGTAGTPARSDTRPAPETINSLLKAVFALERHLVPRWRLPFGVSLLAVFEKAA